MNKIKALVALCAFVVATGFPAARAAAPATPGDAAAKTLVDTFGETCLAYIGREAQLKVWLDANMEVANEKQAPYFLGELPGKVWLRENIAGNYAIIVYDYGLCTVKAQHGPLEAALSYLETVAGPKLNIALTKGDDDPNGSFEDITGHVRTYSFKHEGQDYAIIASGTDSKTAPLQSQFTLIQQGGDPADAKPADAKPGDPKPGDGK